MKKILRFSVPIILAFMFLGMLFYLVGASNRALAFENLNSKWLVGKELAIKPVETQANLLVTTLEDETTPNGNCSLREAIQAANDNTPVDSCPAGDPVITDTITFGVQGTIDLASQLSIIDGGPVVIDGAGQITLDGGNGTCLINTDFGVVAALQGLSLTNGYAGQGGGIYNRGALVVSNSIISNNNSSFTGGGIYNGTTGTITIQNSTLSGNSAVDDGGGIYNDGYYWNERGLVIINHSILINNHTESDGCAIFNYGSLEITDSTLSGNSADDRAGAILETGYGMITISNSTLSDNTALNGGGIHTFGEVSITGNDFIGNSAVADGGGIYNSAYYPVNVTNSTFSGNHANQGGAICCESSISINESTFNNNIADTHGGAIYNQSEITINKSTFSDNNAINNCGGIFNGSWGTITNSTLSGNNADYGGGIYNEGYLDIAVSTLSGNSVGTPGLDHGGGIYNAYFESITMNGTIIAYSDLGWNCAGAAIIDAGYNLEDGDSCGLNPANGSIINTDPLLGPLQNNGGPTWTHELRPLSPAIDAGDNVNCPETDQRGVPRPIDGNGDGNPACDIGAFQFEPGNLVVTTLADEVFNDSFCSLREAIQAANTNTTIEECGTGELVTDTITFDVVGTITLISQLEIDNGGPLEIVGADAITVSGGDSVGIFYIMDESAVLELDDLTIQDGYAGQGGGIYNRGTLEVSNSSISSNHAVADGGSIYNDFGVIVISESTVAANDASEGGGIYNSQGTVTILNCILSDNNASSDGAGIYNWGTLIIDESSLSGNSASDSGGAIFNTGFGLLTITNSTLSGNSAHEGGGISNWGMMTITNSTLSDHTADFGGSIRNGGTLTMTNSTLPGNNALQGGAIGNGGTMTITSSTLMGNSAVDYGGGITNSGTLVLINSTLSANTAGINGGGIDTWSELEVTNSTFSGNSAGDNGGGINNSGMLTISYSTLSGNSASSGGGIYNILMYPTTVNSSIIIYSPLGENCAGDPITDAGNNIEDTDTCGFDPANGSMPNTDPLLGSLQDNGGPTWTHALLEGSPAIDAGDDAMCPSTDQRDFPRPIDGDGNGEAYCDIGSFEFDPGLLVVTTLEDEIISDGFCSLREAIEAANNNIEVEDCGSGDALTDTIIFYGVQGTINLANQLEVAAGGPLVIDGEDVITISGGGATRVWWVEQGSVLTLQNLAVMNGYVYYDYGAGLYNDGSVSIINSTISSNHAETYYGGGIYNLGTLTVTDSILSENSAGRGGAIYNEFEATFTVLNSTLTDNYSSGSGGGIYNNNGASATTLVNITLTENNANWGGGIYSFGTLTITNGIISDNDAVDGGGIYTNYGNLTVINSTIHGNSASYNGGGILNVGYTTTIINSTLSNNSAELGGGIRSDMGNLIIINSTLSANTASLGGGGVGNNVGTFSSINSTFSGNSSEFGGSIWTYGDVTLSNTIIANSPSGGDCGIISGVITDGGHNLDSDDTCGLDEANGSIPGVDPLLGPLQDNGGPTFTHALLPDSPAIDAGDDAQCPPTDQRGVPRPIDGDGDGNPVCDIGSFEFEPGQLVVTTLEDVVFSDSYCSLREALQAANTNTTVEDCGIGGVLTDAVSFDVAGIITVTSQLEVTAGGPLVIDGGGVITTSGGGTTRVWWVEAGSELIMQNIAVVNGVVYGKGGGLYNNYGNLAIDNSTFLGNVAMDHAGGGIYNLGTITITQSTFSDNYVHWENGGGINNHGSQIVNYSLFTGNIGYNCGGISNNGILTINHSTFSENSTWFWNGEGLCNYGSVILNASTFSGNSGESGGGVTNSGTMTITNSTFSGNSGDTFGGGIINYGMIEITNSTIADNSATSGGGIYCNGCNTYLVNTIIANSLSGNDCWVENGAMVDNGYNLDSDNSCNLDPENGSLPGVDPLLGPLQDNGSPTWTHELLPGSPAIDAGDDSKGLSIDQRGVPRPLDGDDDGVAVCDIGSYEREYPPISPNLVTISGASEGIIGPVTYFTATVEPVSTTLPITYVWQASRHPPITETRGLTDTVGWAWEMPGTQYITVTASNGGCSVMDTHTITITTPILSTYLPLISRFSSSPLGSIPSFPAPLAGTFVGLCILGILGRWKKNK